MTIPEVLGPEDARRQRLDREEREVLQRAAEFLATLLDTAIRIPGTNISLGLDPLLGLIPGIGDAIASFIGSVILLLAARLGVPKITLVRMNLNLLINGAVGAIPVAGDIFSVWFKSNARNAALLARATADRSLSSSAADWVFVLGLLLATLTLLLAVIAGILWLTLQLWRFLQ